MNENTIFFLIALYWAGFMLSVGVFGVMVYLVWNTIVNLFSKR